MFSAIRPTCSTISDLNLAAYLMLRGAKLEGVEVIAPKRGAFIFTHKRLADLIHAYHQHAEIRFSPKALFEGRESLKRMSFVPLQK
jgi:hypothetical protein